MSTTHPLMNQFTSSPEFLFSGSSSVSCPSISVIAISFFQGSLPGRPLLRRSRALQSSIRSSSCDGTGCTIPDPFYISQTVRQDPYLRNAASDSENRLSDKGLPNSGSARLVFRISTFLEGRPIARWNRSTG